MTQQDVSAFVNDLRAAMQDLQVSCCVLSAPPSQSSRLSMLPMMHCTMCSCVAYPQPCARLGAADADHRGRGRSRPRRRR